MFDEDDADDNIYEAANRLQSTNPEIFSPKSVICTITVMVVIAGFVSMLGLTPKGYAPFFWTKTVGAIETTKYEYIKGVPDRYHGSDSRLDSSEVLATYSYSVNGQEYRATNVKARYPEFLESISNEFARALASTGKVDVLYNPNKPAESVLARIDNQFLFFAPWFVVGLLSAYLIARCLNHSQELLSKNNLQLVFGVGNFIVIALLVFLGWNAYQWVSHPAQNPIDLHKSVIYKSPKFAARSAAKNSVQTLTVLLAKTTPLRPATPLPRNPAQAIPLHSVTPHSVTSSHR